MDEKVKESDITIENDIGVWQLLHHGAVGGTYMGTFRFRCFLTPMQVLEADRDFRELLGPNAQFAASNSENVAFALAQLRQRVVGSPPFWTEGGGRFPGGGIKDLDVLDMVLEAAVAAEVKYRKQLADRHTDAINRIKATIERRQKEAETNKELGDPES